MCILIHTSAITIRNYAELGFIAVRVGDIVPHDVALLRRRGSIVTCVASLDRCHWCGAIRRTWSTGTAASRCHILPVIKCGDKQNDFAATLVRTERCHSARLSNSLNRVELRARQMTGRFGNGLSGQSIVPVLTIKLATTKKKTHMIAF